MTPYMLEETSKESLENLEMAPQWISTSRLPWGFSKSPIGVEGGFPVFPQGI